MQVFPGSLQTKILPRSLRLSCIFHVKMNVFCWSTSEAQESTSTSDKSFRVYDYTYPKSIFNAVLYSLIASVVFVEQRRKNTNLRSCIEVQQKNKEERTAKDIQPDRLIKTRAYPGVQSYQNTTISVGLLLRISIIPCWVEEVIKGTSLARFGLGDILFYNNVLRFLIQTLILLRGPTMVLRSWA